MSDIMVRILLAKLGDGYDQATLQLGKALLDAGFEVIYTNTQEPEAIVISALQETVDHIGITFLPGAKISDLEIITTQLAKEDASDIQVTVGGFLKEEDMPKLKEMGIREIFPRGTTFAQLVNWAREHIKPLDL
jgi:methylmalonyl-CoA mutase C-terminal domain/subunit